MFDEIASISYQKTGSLGILEYFKLDLSSRMPVVNYMGDACACFVDTGKIKDSRKRKLVHAEKLGCISELIRFILLLEERYIDNNCLDGIQWTICIEHTDGSKRIYLGKNAWPINWYTFENIKNKLLY